jgi:hypothetical protein
MKYSRILERASRILWDYKALWIMGFILAFVSVSYSGSGITTRPNNGWSYQFNQGDNLKLPGNFPPGLQNEFNRFGQVFEKVFTGEVIVALIIIDIALLSVMILIGVAFAVIRYVTETGIIRMVDKYEISGEKVKWTRGFVLGWSRSAWQLFLIDLVFRVPVIIVFFFLFCFAALPLFINPAGIFITFGEGIMLIFLAIGVKLATNLFTRIVWRACVIERRGVFDSIRRGWKLFVARFMNIFVLGLINTGIRIGYGLVMIPVFLFLLGMGLVGGGVTGLLLFLALKNVGMVLAIIVAVFAGILVMSTIIGLPMTLIQGFLLTYLSTDWTLAYRELMALESAKSLPAAPVEPAPPPNRMVASQNSE